jgi:hypothetical protein
LFCCCHLLRFPSASPRVRHHGRKSCYGCCFIWRLIFGAQKVRIFRGSPQTLC